MKWEYRVVTISFSMYERELEVLLDVMGQEGWELCSISPGATRAIFKRQKRD